MADYILPSGSKFFGSTGVDQVQFIRTGHTADLPRLAVFKRRQAKGGPTWDYTVSLVQGAPPDSQGVVRNTLVEFHCRGVTGQDNTAIKALLTVLGTMLTNADFQDDCVVELLLPSPTAIAV